MVRDGWSRHCLGATNRHMDVKKRRRRMHRALGALARRLNAGGKERAR